MPFPVLPAWMKGRVRLAVGNMLPDTCQIQAKTLTAGGTAGFTDTWTTVTTSSYRYDPDSEENDPSLGEDSLLGKGIITLPYNTTVDAKNRLVDGSKIFEILSLEDNDSYLIDKRVKVVRID